MKLKLNPEQTSFLQSLKSQKKKRKFLLDCLVEEIEKKVNPISLSDFLKNQVRTPLDYLNRPDKLCVDSNKVYRGIPENLKEPQTPMNFCVEITDENAKLLNSIWQNFNHTKGSIAVACKFLNSNSAINYLAPSVGLLDSVKIVTTEEFLKYIGREDLIFKKEATNLSRLYNPELIKEFEQIKEKEDLQTINTFDELTEFISESLMLEIYELGKKDQQEISKTDSRYQKRRENYLRDKFIKKYTQNKTS